MPADTIAGRIITVKQAGPMLVAIDGVETAGKTTLADQVAVVLAGRGMKVARASIDRFHNPRAIRKQRGELSPEGFYRDSFDLQAVVELVLRPVKQAAGAITLGIYDYRSDAAHTVETVAVTPELIVLFDGIFLLREELRGYWDLAVYLDVTADTVLRRATVRDLALFGSEEEVVRRYTQRYLPGEQMYIAECAPQARADIVVDMNEWDRPRIVKDLAQPI